MLASLWNLLGFQLVNAMPRGKIFTATYNIRNILTDIVARPGVEREVKGDWSWWRPIQGYRQQSDKGVLR
jgi:hypothetical protein